MNFTYILTAVLFKNCLVRAMCSFNINWRLILVRLFILYFGVSTIIWAALREVKFSETETWSRLLLVRWKTGGQGNHVVGFLVNFLLVFVSLFVCLTFSWFVCLFVYLFIFCLFVCLFHVLFVCFCFAQSKFRKGSELQNTMPFKSYIYERRDEEFLPLAGSYPDYIFVCVEKVFVRRFLSSQAKPNISGSGQR